MYANPSKEVNFIFMPNFEDTIYMRININKRKAPESTYNAPSIP